MSMHKEQDDNAFLRRHEQELGDLATSIAESSLGALLIPDIVNLIVSFSYRDPLWKVAGLHHAKELLLDAVLDLQHPIRKRNEAILLRGSSGCGSTFLAKSVMELFPDIHSKSISVCELVGDLARFTEFFQLAQQQQQPVILVLNDFQCLSTPWAGNLLWSVLSELDTIRDRGNTNRVLFIATQMLSKDREVLSPETLSRFSRKVHIPVPDRAARYDFMEMFMKNAHTGRRDVTFTQEDIDHYVDSTEGLSGAELQALFNNVAMSSFSDLHEKGHCRKVDDGTDSYYYEMCAETDSDAVHVTDVPGDDFMERIRWRAVTRHDLDVALARSRRP